MKQLHLVATAVALTILFSCSQAQTQPSAALQLRTIIPLPNVKGRIDHMDIDLKTQRVFIAALENNTVEVVNMTEGKWVRSLDGFKEPQGVLYRPESNRLFVTNGGEGTCSVLDAT